jgi:hypothetical protein
MKSGRSLQTSLALAALLAASLASGQGAPPPPGLAPVPEPPPLPPGEVTTTPPAADQPAPEPQVTVIRRGEETVEEYRINGRMYMMKVTPPTGQPYFLIDHRGDGVFTRQQSLDNGLRPPMWVLFRW